MWVLGSSEIRLQFLSGLELHWTVITMDERQPNVSVSGYSPRTQHRSDLLAIPAQQRCMGGWMHERMDARVDAWMDTRMDARVG